MRKRISIFLCTMMALMMATGSAMAETISEAKEVNKETYDEQYYGDSSEFWARSTSSVAYTTIENTTSYNRYIECDVYEITANEGQTDYAETDAYVLKGIQIDAQVSRDINLIGYYKHTGSASYNEYSGVSLDTYSYKAYQNQEIVN